MKGTFSTYEVARMLGVSAGSVANWIDQGQLNAGRTPGGHRRIARSDVQEFLRQQNLPIPAPLERAAPLILVVDDEPAVAQYLALEIAGAKPEWRVQQAHDGFTAGQMVGSEKPQIVLLDLRMPDLDGFEVCRRIKANPETEATVVLAMTAYPSAQSEQRILDCGAQVCLIKPLEIKLLLKEMSEAFRNKPKSAEVSGAGR